MATRSPRKSAVKKSPAARKAAAKKAPRRAPPHREVAPEARAEAPSEPPREPAAEPQAVPPRTLPIEIDPRRIEETLGKLQGELKHWVNKGRFTKVRFRFRGKQLLPDLPLAAVVAAQGLTFYWAGLLRLLLVNVAGGSVLDVELVSDADAKVQAGREALLSGEVELALLHFRNALEMDRDHPAAHLQLGVALKLEGEREAARAELERARELDPKGAVGVEAERILQGMAGPPQA